VEALVSLVFTFLGMVAVSSGPRSAPLSLSSIGLALYNFTVAWMYLNREPAKRVACWWETALAIGGTFLPLLALRPAPMASAEGVREEVGMLVQLFGLTGMIWSVFTLGVSLGIAPADRGLVTLGPYRRVRHPMYAFELLSCLGYWLANLTWLNVIAWLLLAAIQVTRALREERIIEGYEAYAARVRWRFLPGLI
jgi:protein-S-isoprenylcysteine O-methyltransferase Ste14